VSIAVLAEVIFFYKRWFLAPSSLTRTASSPNRLASMIAPNPLKKVPKAIYMTPLGYKSFPMR